MNLLQELFSYVCGQQHCWVLGGVRLPVCERCTGLYIGAFCGLILVFLFRPRPRAALYWIHGVWMLLMLPFGFHLVQHGGLTRTLTGALFGFGLVYYLVLNPLTQWRAWAGDSSLLTMLYFGLLGMALGALLLAVSTGKMLAAWILIGTAVMGLLALFLCVLVNIAVLPLVLRTLRNSSQVSA